MTTGGWIIMSVSVAAVTLLFVWSIAKVLRTPGETEKMHGFEFETPDEKTDRDPS
ncbi:MAG: hypothetical protein KDM91_21090 [Verrucomicrobiae bacterium]|nr:hypothetical protein [Verrucomicrobiae bacterium]MCP5541375.1 hypothetical protein [Akkermansiaceae bacterium]